MRWPSSDLAGLSLYRSPLARLVFLVNDPKFLLSHRFSIATAAVRAGYDVHLACPRSDATSIIEAAGVHTHRLPLERGIAPAVAEFRTIGHVASLYRRLRPTIVHHVTVKPVLYGLARCAGYRRQGGSSPCHLRTRIRVLG